MARKFVGPTGSRRRRWLFLFTTIAALAAAAFFIAGAGAVTGSPSGFESADGNMTLQTSGKNDWNCFAGPSNTGGFSKSAGFPPSGCAKTSGATNIPADPAGEVQWVGGQKFDTQCPALNTGNNPPKDEFTDVSEFTEFSTSGPTSGDLF